jgi:hypothetical protein
MPMNPRLLRPLARQAGALPGTPASLLLRFDGNFNDSSANALTVTANGDASINTTTKKYGSGSAYFDGDGDYLSIAASAALELGAGDWTVEFWFMRLSGTPAYELSFSSWHNTGSAFWFGVENGEINVSLNDNALNFDGQNSSGATNLDQWYHYACTRESDTVRLFLDGALVHSATFTASVDALGGDVEIGGFNYDGGGVTSMFGYLDDVRVVKGLAVYTANFTPPTGPLAVNATPVT